MRRSAVISAVAVFAVAVGAALGVTFGAFSATTSNGGNNFAAAASFGAGLEMATGTYDGNDVDGRLITTGFQPDLVIVKDDVNQDAMAKTSTMIGDASKTLAGADNLQTDAIQSFETNGFTVGTDQHVNGNNHTYYWAAFKAAPEVFSVGTYTGNATSRSISGLGFSPEYVAIMGAGGQQPRQRYADMGRSYQFDTDTGTTGAITSLDADGFSLGTGAETNADGVAFHYVAFNQVSGSIKAGSYLGNGNNNRNLTGVGFQAHYLMVRADHTNGIGKEGVHRPASLAGNSSLSFDAQGPAANQIQAFQADGFQLGSNPEVNDSGVTYHYLAVRNTGA